MAERICSVPGCGRRHRALDLCSMHWKRKRRYGSLDLPVVTVLDRFWAKVDVRGPDDCWHWTGSRVKGYGTFGLGRRVDGTVLAHRFAYEIAVGPIPDGMSVDHECHNGSGCRAGDACLHRRCVNPSHLRARPLVENARLARAGHTHCAKGHLLAGDNLRIRANGWRSCRACAHLSYLKRKRAL
jgi:hypothetical protein